MEKSSKYYPDRKEFHSFVANSYPELVKLKKEGRKAAFNELLVKTLPAVTRNIKKSLSTALSKGQLPKGKYTTSDFTDQLLIELYEHFDEVKNANELHPWMFKKAQELLRNRLNEEEFDTYFFENIDKYSKAEWDELQEKFTADGEGDLIMFEELDDVSYQRDTYLLKNVFLRDDQKELTSKLDRELSRDELARHSEMVLYHLPLTMRTVYELFTEHHFDLEEISEIMNLSLKEVEQLLEESRKSLEASLHGRYLYQDH